MKSKTFENGLVVKHRKSAIFFENAGGKDEGESRFIYPFTPEQLRAFTDYLTEVAGEAWANITPKDATSEASDYFEYYDRRYDNNGYLRIRPDGLHIKAPHLSTDTLYQFNKAKIQSFIYDLNRKTKEITAS